MVFSKAFQDLIGEIMKLKQENRNYKQEISLVKKELVDLRASIEKEARTRSKKEKIKRKYKKAKDKLETREKETKST